MDFLPKIQPLAASPGPTLCMLPSYSELIDAASSTSCTGLVTRSISKQSGGVFDVLGFLEYGFVLLGWVYFGLETVLGLGFG